ncbi:hypothetical protein GUJ93_ZPchr0009g1791 [Zizania palustris]|uniref:Uncharacterized protein n=1 Tax=Zizania palustris TaxID=103762 RepID=A0A8J5R1S3_ZIZPA|nr:hypothetical protein GUJ93_ZPchr0009g1791 [Zizania palustris]
MFRRRSVLVRLFGPPGASHLPLHGHTCGGIGASYPVANHGRAGVMYLSNSVFGSSRQFSWEQFEFFLSHQVPYQHGQEEIFLLSAENWNPCGSEELFTLGSMLSLLLQLPAISEYMVAMSLKITLVSELQPR